VNPLAEITSGDFRGESYLNKSQHRKQWCASWKFMAGIHTKLWQGMQLTSATYAAWVDVYGYDFFLGHCIQRSAFIGDAEWLKQPTEMVRSLLLSPMDTTIADHNELLLSFHQRICKQVIKSPPP
jgi:hypothetical protein